jgi:ketosteroid isomerase-like protein
MPTLRRFPIALVLLLAGCGGAGTAGDADAAPAEAVAMADGHRIAIADSVRRTLEAFANVVQQMDPTEIASFYADDADMRWIEDGEVVYRGPRDVAEAIQALRTTMAVGRLSYDGVEITPLAPGVALVVAGFAQQFTTVDGETGGFAGAMTAVMVHRNGRWLFLSGHTSSVGNRSRPA